MSIASQITRLQNAKTAIKASIVAKGVSVPTEAKFDSYSGYIDSISSGVSPNTWTRPSDWTAMPTVTTSDEKFVGLYAIYENSDNWACLKVSGNFTVDWGDGNVINYSSGTLAEHSYNYATCGGAVSSRGYKTLLITVTAQSGQHLTSINLKERITAYSTSDWWPTSWLDIVISGQYLTTLNFIATSMSYSYHFMLERVRIIRSALTNGFGKGFSLMYALRSVDVSGLNGVTTCSNMFQSCYALQYVDLSPMVALTSLYFTFDGCYNLRAVKLPSSTGVLTEVTYAFNYCYSLTSVTGFSCLNACTSLNNMFPNCYSLSDVTFDAVLSAVTSMSSIFNNCYGLRSFDFSKVPNCVNFYSAFSSCYSLTTVDMSPIVGNVNQMGYAFSSCRSLKKITFPTNLILSASSPLDSMVNGCSQLEYVDISTASFTSSSSVAMSYTFSGCTCLRTVKLPTLPAGKTYNTPFSSCISLQVLRFPAYESFSITSCDMSAAALNTLYGDLQTVTGKTLTVTSNYGAAASNTSIATAKGWTVTN